MQGNNELHLNQATMVEAIQHYIDTVLLKTEGIKVTSVDKNSGSAYEMTFVVKLSKEE